MAFVLTGKWLCAANAALMFMCARVPLGALLYVCVPSHMWMRLVFFSLFFCGTSIILIRAVWDLQREIFIWTGSNYLRGDSH